MVRLQPDDVIDSGDQCVCVPKDDWMTLLKSAGNGSMTLLEFVEDGSMTLLGSVEKGPITFLESDR